VVRLQDSESFSQLIGNVYDAALDPSQWPGVLGDIARLVGGPSAGLIAKDAARKSGDVFFTDGGIDPHYTRLYFDKYVKIDPMNAGHFFAEIGQPVSTIDVMPFEEFHQTRVWKEWVQPQGIVDYISVALDKTATGVALLGVFRHERNGIVDDAARGRVRLIAPHVRRAVLIGKAIDLTTTEAANLVDTLDGIAAGMFLVDACARIMHANAAGHAMLAAGNFLRAPGGWLAATDPQADRTLREIFAAAGGGDAAVGVEGIAVPLAANDGERLVAQGLVAHVLPLTSGARRKAGTTYAAAAALFVSKAALAGPSPPEAIAKAYKLTPMELRVLLAIVEIGGAPEVAEALGIGETTVKSHLRGLFEKTGARRQADLVKLLAGVTSPLLR
jgi:DNA-binding CsgD family transcriptional regulator